jgi:hypothetical protein
MPFKITPVTQIIIDLMTARMNDENSLITYIELEQATGLPMSEIRSHFYSARRKVRNDHGKWFHCDRLHGYRAVDDENLPECAKVNRGKARNLHRENIKILGIADPAKQSAEARRRTMVERSVAELAMAATAPRSIARIEQMVARAHNRLSLEQQIAAIKDALSPRPTSPPAAGEKPDG